MTTAKRKKKAITAVDPTEPAGPVVTPPPSKMPAAMAEPTPPPVPEARRRNRHRSVTFSDSSEPLRMTVERHSGGDARVELESNVITSTVQVRREDHHDIKVHDGWNEILARMNRSGFETHIRAGEGQDIVITQDDTVPSVDIELMDSGRVFATVIVSPRFVKEGAAPAPRAGRYALEPMPNGNGFSVVNQDGVDLLTFRINGK